MFISCLCSNSNQRVLLSAGAHAQYPRVLALPYMFAIYVLHVDTISHMADTGPPVPFRVVSSRLVSSCSALLCLVSSCPVPSCFVSSRPVSSSSRLVLPRPVPSRRVSSPFRLASRRPVPSCRPPSCICHFSEASSFRFCVGQTCLEVTALLFAIC